VDKKEESLSRAASSSSGKSITQLSVGGVPASPKMYLNPVSPLSFQPVHESIQEQPPFEYALLSQIAESFAQQVTLLNDSRRIFCTAEYPLSFNGEEAMVNQQAASALCVYFG
jgi:hypothetical protein